MNFLEKILDNLHRMTAGDVIESIARKIYDEPIEREELTKYPQFISDIIFIIDFDTEMTMQGDVLQNSICEFVPNIITAFKNIKAENDTNILQEIYERYQQNEDDEMINNLYNKIYINTDFDIWPILDAYVEKEIIKYRSRE